MNILGYIVLSYSATDEDGCYIMHTDNMGDVLASKDRPDLLLEFLSQKDSIPTAG